MIDSRLDTLSTDRNWSICEKIEIYRMYEAFRSDASQSLRSYAWEPLPLLSSIVHVLDETVQNVGSCERMLGLKVGPARPSPFLVEFSLRVRVLEAHAAALFGAARS